MRELELSDFIKEFNVTMQEVPSFVREKQFQLLYTMEGIPYGVRLPL